MLMIAEIFSMLASASTEGGKNAEKAFRRMNMNQKRISEYFR